MALWSSEASMDASAEAHLLTPFAYIHAYRIFVTTTSAGLVSVALLQYTQRIRDTLEANLHTQRKPRRSPLQQYLENA
jgi:hypothetical protein